MTLAQARQLSPRSKRVNQGTLSPVSSGYSYARQHLPLSVVEAASDLVFDDLARRAAAQAPVSSAAPVYLLDGSSLTLAPSPALRAAFPPSVNQHGPSHWSVVRMVVAHALPTGLAVRPAWGPMYGPHATSEQALATEILPRVPAGAWVIADRNFGVLSVAWTIVAHGQTPVVRMLAARAQKVVGTAVDLTRDGDHAVVWTPSDQDRGTTPDLPKTARLRGRVVVRHVRPEGRPVCLCLFTTDETATADSLVATYGQRWLIEVDLRSLKQTVSIESTGVRSPALLAQDLLMAVSAYNLLRWLMQEAATLAELPARRISFTRNLRYARAYAPRLVQVDDLAARQPLWREMLVAIAALPLPLSLIQI